MKILNDDNTKNKKEASVTHAEPTSKLDRHDSPVSTVDRINRVYTQRYVDPDAIYNRLQKAIFEKSNFLGYREGVKGVNVSRNSKTGNASFFRNNNDVLTLVVFGELAPMYSGTKITAIGNHYPWDEPITLKEKIKWVLALREPSMSTPAVSRAFNRQLDNLNELLVMCEHGRTAMDEALAKGQRIKPFVRAANEDTAEKVIPLYTHAAIYSEERQTAQSVLGEDGGPEKPVEASRMRMTIEEARSRVQYPITVHTLYHPDCLVDHHDSRFDDHTGVYLYQKDIRDIKGQLVEPWRMQSVYKPGTLVLAVCTFKMWCQGSEGSSETQHFYNIQLRQVKVIAESPEEEEVPGMTPLIQTTSRLDPFQSIPEFESFSAVEEPPAKRPRLSGSSK